MQLIFGLLTLISGLLTLVVALLCGEMIKAATGIAIPAPVLAIIVLFGFCLALRRVPEGLRRVAGFMLRHMALFFIPALVSLLALQDMLAQLLLPLALIVIVSTIIPLAVTALVFQTLAPRPISMIKSTLDDATPKTDGEKMSPHKTTRDDEGI